MGQGILILMKTNEVHEKKRRKTKERKNGGRRQYTVKYARLKRTEMNMCK